MKLRLPIVKPDWIEYLFRNPTVDPDSEESISFMKTCLINEITGWTVSTTGFTAAEQALIVDRIKHLGMCHEQIMCPHYLVSTTGLYLFICHSSHLRPTNIGGKYIPSLPSSATCLIVKDLSVDSAKVGIFDTTCLSSINTLKSSIDSSKLQGNGRWKFMTDLGSLVNKLVALFP